MKEAIDWWRSLSIEEKIKLKNNYFHWFEFTWRLSIKEILHIYTKEIQKQSV